MPRQLHLLLSTQGPRNTPCCKGWISHCQTFMKGWEGRSSKDQGCPCALPRIGKTQPLLVVSRTYFQTFFTYISIHFFHSLFLEGTAWHQLLSTANRNFVTQQVLQIPFWLHEATKQTQNPLISCQVLLSFSASHLDSTGTSYFQNQNHTKQTKTAHCLLFILTLEVTYFFPKKKSRILCISTPNMACIRYACIMTCVWRTPSTSLPRTKYICYMQTILN